MRCSTWSGVGRAKGFIVARTVEERAILDTARDQFHKKLEALPEVEVALAVNRHLITGDEIWLFVVMRDQLQIGEDLKVHLATLLAETSSVDVSLCRVYQLSSLPMTRGGRIMALALERLVNHQSLPNRLRMRNPEVLNEIMRVVSA